MGRPIFRPVTSGPVRFGMGFDGPDPAPLIRAADLAGAPKGLRPVLVNGSWRMRWKKWRVRGD